jgi:hypothetical protein
MTTRDIANAFDGQRFKTADELAIALGRKPGKAWQRNLARALREFPCAKDASDNNLSDRRIRPKFRQVGGRFARVYDLNDFKTPQAQKEEENRRIEANLAKLRTGNAMVRLQELEQRLKADGIGPAERLRRVMVAIEIERRKAGNME